MFSFLWSFLSGLNFSSVSARFTLWSPLRCSDAPLLWPHPHVNNKPHSAPPHLWGNPLAGHLCLSDKEQYRCFILTVLFLFPWLFLNDFQTPKVWPNPAEADVSCVLSRHNSRNIQSAQKWFQSRRDQIKWNLTLDKPEGMDRYYSQTWPGLIEGGVKATAQDGDLSLLISQGYS